MARVVDITLDKMLAHDGLQNAPFDLDTVLETDALARARASEVMSQLG
jgi:1-deoxy-D-xylulose-5-phosphate reductoisomerase